jgi:deoxyribonuclease V
VSPGALHAWTVDPREAVRIQKRLAGLVRLEGPFRGTGGIRTVAGCDLASDPATGTLHAAVVVYAFPSLEEIERKSARSKAPFPYVPGLLSFREAPVLLEAFARLEVPPDVVIFDGQGIAHPRGIGIASHAGLWIGRPTVGCAKSRLCGAHDEPGPLKGSASPLRDARGRRIGTVLRTRDRTRPVFVSPGHLIDPATAAALVLACADGRRIPKPTREADRWAEALKRGAAERLVGAAP